MLVKIRHISSTNRGQMDNFFKEKMFLLNLFGPEICKYSKLLYSELILFKDKAYSKYRNFMNKYFILVSFLPLCGKAIKKLSPEYEMLLYFRPGGGAPFYTDSAITATVDYRRRNRGRGVAPCDGPGGGAPALSCPVKSAMRNCLSLLLILKRLHKM